MHTFGGFADWFIVSPALFVASEDVASKESEGDEEEKETSLGDKADFLAVSLTFFSTLVLDSLTAGSIRFVFKGESGCKILSKICFPPSRLF